MPLERFTIEQLSGIATNPAEGLTQQAPVKLIADLQVAGGYRPIKGGTVLVGTGPTFTNVPTFTIKGEDGYALAYEAGGFANYDLFDGDAYVGSISPAFGTMYWLPGVGLYETKNLWLYYDITGVIEQSSDWNGSVSMALTSGGTGTYNSIAYTVFAEVFLQTAGGRAFMEEVSGVITPASNEEITVELTFTEVSAQASADIYIAQGVTGTLYYAGTISAASSPGTLTSNTLPTASTTMPWSTQDGATLLHYDLEGAVFHRQRMYGVTDTQNYEFLGFTDPNSDIVTSFYNRLPRTTVVYSEFGYAQWAGDSNWFAVPSKTGQDIVSLVSSPGGLIIFMPTETYLMRGDPVGADFSITLLSGSLGLDDHLGFATMGGVVFIISKGEVYSVALGMGDVDFGQGINKISDPVFDPNDVFEQLAVDYSKRHLVALKNSGEIVRYDFDSTQWLSDPLSDSSVDFIIPNPDTNSVRYVVDIDDIRVLTGALQNVEVDFEALDLGDKNLHKMWRRVEVFTDAAYASTPTMRYTVRGASATVNGLDQGDGRWVFTFGPGVVGPTADLEFTFPSPTSSTVIEPPIHIYYAPRYREV